jgi:hypothetical protein
VAALGDVGAVADRGSAGTPRLFAQQFDAGEDRWLFAHLVWRSAERLLGGGRAPTASVKTAWRWGHWLQAHATGKGFMTEAADALTRLALQQAQESSVVQIRCDPRTSSSAAVPRRLWLTVTLRTIPNATVKPSGAARDSMVWEITRAARSNQSTVSHQLHVPSCVERIRFMVLTH